MNNNNRLWAAVPLLFASCLMHAQGSGAGLTPTLYDMSGFYNTELNGTARYVGMGGAMNALGGDLSVMSTNPAGIGLYRRSDVAVSGGVAAFNNDMGEFGKAKETRGTINQAGFVYTNHVDGPSLKYFNLGFNYHKLNNFRGKSNWQGSFIYNDNNGNRHYASQTMLMSDMTNGMGAGILEEDDYNAIKNATNANNYYQNDPNLGWLTIMGIRTGLISPMISNNTNKLDRYEGYEAFNGGNYSSETRGGIDSYDFNMSFNFNDRFYLGLTLGALDVNYDYYSRYSEDLFDIYATDPTQSVGSYAIENWKKTTGSGFNLTMGAIVRPIEESAFRFGIAVKTPTWYRLTDTYSTSVSSNIGGKTAGEQTGLTYDYRFQTPWSFNLSVGHTIGNFLALDAEYDYTDYSTAKLKDADGIDGDENKYIKDMLKASHSFKVGAEWRIAPDFALRAGYNYLSNVMDTKKAYYMPGYNSINTRTEYANMKNAYNLTFGFGYSGNNFYADLAYLYNRRNYDFYPFGLSTTGGSEVNDMIPPTKLKAERQQVLLTIGYKF